jgi:hypothetical protein
MSGERPEHDDEVCPTLQRPCYRCHLDSIKDNIGQPSDFASRSTYLKNPPRTPNNSYEKGIPTSRRPDGSEMPYLRADGETMGQREFDSKRHQIEENRKKANAGLLVTPN